MHIGQMKIAVNTQSLSGDSEMLSWKKSLYQKLSKAPWNVDILE